MPNWNKYCKAIGMDREISKEAKRKRRLRMALSVAAPVLVLAGVAAALIFTGGKTYN